MTTGKNLKRAELRAQSKKTKKVLTRSLPVKVPKAAAATPHLLVPIVAIGASAGGLEALEGFFTHMPHDENLAFVVVTHLDPTHYSLLPELLQKITQMKVCSITSRMAVEAGYVYVLPPNNKVIIKDGVLQLIKHKTANKDLTIDVFFKSLAEEQKRKIIAVVLSGTGSDGSQGLKLINSAGGLVIAQDPASAKYNGMPISAINTGLVDAVLSLDKIPQQILQYLSCDIAKTISKEEETLKELHPIYQLLHTHVGHDFSLYKYNTICRRIEKRMSFHRIDSLALYTRYLQHNPNELSILFKDLLIGVTNFFRNPEAFAILKTELLLLLKSKTNNHNVRIWVPACSTGEEAYSIAILLQECMDELKRDFHIQIFGTDLDEKAIEIARAGLYPADITENVNNERLQRFFIKEEKSYRVSKDIRKMVIFAIQNITKDPPFTKLDLLSCRNLLIYFTAELQKKLLPIFYYSLNYNGILFLGSAENISHFDGLFTIIDKKWRLFKRKEGTFPFQTGLELDTRLPLLAETTSTNRVITAKEPEKMKLAHLVETILLENYVPVCIVINEKDDIVYIHGRTGKYLEPAKGAANLNILQMARPGLKLKLAMALRQVNMQRKSVSYNNLQIQEEDKLHWINLKTQPFGELSSNHFWKIIIIEEAHPSQHAELLNGKHVSNAELTQQIALMEQELKQSKENLQTTIEALETSNEELKSSNEELQSTNEELQSTNEELETSKEELQSLNEELTTVNSELETRIDELSTANDDIQNLLYSTEVAAIFLDNELHVKRFTPKATALTNLILTDVGRPLTDIVSKIQYTTLVEDVRTVLSTLSLKTMQVQNDEGHWFQARIMPYRTLTNLIDGVVITFLDIDLQKQAETLVKKLKAEANRLDSYIISIVNTAHEPLLVLNENLQVIAGNSAFYTLFQTTLEDIRDYTIYQVWDGKTNKDLLQQLFEKECEMRDFKKNFEITYHTPGSDPKKLALNVRRIKHAGAKAPTILVAIAVCP